MTVDANALLAFAAAPLDRVLVSAAGAADGLLSTVGAMSTKQLLLKGEEVLALAVAEGQGDLQEQNGKVDGKPVLRAATLAELVGEVVGRLGDHLFGPVVPLPPVLREAAPEDAAYDYAAASYYPLDFLDGWVAAHVRAPPKGYLVVEGVAGSGKTSWALHWQRASTGEVSDAGPVPRLAGWYYARRFGVDGAGYQDELRGLQTLVSLARRRYAVVPKADQRELYDTAFARKYDEALRTGDQRYRYEAELRQRFLEALQQVAIEAEAQRTGPVVLLIDGGDELWSAGSKYARSMFPEILPDTEQLPNGIYIVLLSRPGAHLRLREGIRPIGHYQFQRADVDQAIRSYLSKVASGLEATDPEAAALLQDKSLQKNVCVASEGAFGYAPLLVRDWFRSPTDHRLGVLRGWLSNPGSLPAGVYGLRARELLHLHQAVDQNLKSGQLSLLEVMALPTVLRWPLTPRDLVELIYPGTAGDSDLAALPGPHDLDRLLVETVASWLSRDSVQYGHQNLAEVAQAGWRLESCRHPLTESSVAAEARAIAESAQRTSVMLTVEQCAQADAKLHARLVGGRLDQRQPTIGWNGAQGAPTRWRDQDTPTPTKPWSPPGADIDTVTGYSWVWGPWHALQAASQITDDSVQTLGRRARDLMIDAPYLQSAIRAEAHQARRIGRLAEPESMRLTYIAADDLEGDDPGQPLRHRIESELLQWYEALIADGQLTVGGLLWNMLGDWQRGRDHAQAWRESIDMRALITSFPGHPPEFQRRLDGYTDVAVTSCGQWLVTSGSIGTAVWSLAAGFHRPQLFAHSELRLGTLRVASVNNAPIFAGVPLRDAAVGSVSPGMSGEALSGDIAIATVEPTTRRVIHASYAGHLEAVSDIALEARAELIVVASISNREQTVGLLSLTLENLYQDANDMAVSQPPHPYRVARYYCTTPTGHPGVMGHMERLEMQCSRVSVELVNDWIFVASALFSGIGLLAVTADEPRAHAAEQAENNEVPNCTLMTYVALHDGPIWSVSTAIVCERVVVASTASDKTVGVMMIYPSDVRKRTSIDARAQEFAEALIARYAGHNQDPVGVRCTILGNMTIVVSCALDGTVGILRVSEQSLARDAVRTAGNTRPLRGQLMQYAAYTRTPNNRSVSPEVVAVWQAGKFLVIGVATQDRGVDIVVTAGWPVSRGLLSRVNPRPQVRSEAGARLAWEVSQVTQVSMVGKGDRVCMVCAGLHPDCVVMHILMLNDLERIATGSWDRRTALQEQILGLFDISGSPFMRIGKVGMQDHIILIETWSSRSTHMLAISVENLMSKIRAKSAHSKRQLQGAVFTCELDESPTWYLVSTGVGRIKTAMDGVVSWVHKKRKRGLTNHPVIGTSTRGAERYWYWPLPPSNPLVVHPVGSHAQVSPPKSPPPRRYQWSFSEPGAMSLIAELGENDASSGKEVRLICPHFLSGVQMTRGIAVNASTMVAIGVCSPIGHGKDWQIDFAPFEGRLALLPLELV